MTAPQPDDLRAENLLLGAIVDDLRSRCVSQEAAVAAAAASPPKPPQALRETEDALLDMHQECKLARQALRRQTEVLQRTQAQLTDARRAAARQHEAAAAKLAQCGAAEHALMLEIAALEREVTGGPSSLERARTAELERTARDAVQGMQAAQRECRWLHEQLCACVQQQQQADALSATAVSGALRAEMMSATPGTSGRALLSEPQPAHGGDGGGGGGGGGGGSLLAAVGSSGGGGGHEGAAMHAMRSGYVKAVERCHELHRHVAMLAEQDGRLRPQLAQALERVATTQQQIDELQRENALLRRSGGGGGGDGGGMGVGMGDGGGGGRSGGWGASVAASPHAALRQTAADVAHAVRSGALASGAGAGIGADDGGGGVFGGGGGGGGGAVGAGGGGGGGGGGGASLMLECCALRAALATAEAQLLAAEKQLARRQAEHSADQLAMVEAQRAAADAVRALQAESEWVRALDEMRLHDMHSIQQLEAQLHQWAAFHPPQPQLQPPLSAAMSVRSSGPPTPLAPRAMPLQAAPMPSAPPTPTRLPPAVVFAPAPAAVASAFHFHPPPPPAR